MALNVFNLDDEFYESCLNVSNRVVICMFGTVLCDSSLVLDPIFSIFHPNMQPALVSPPTTLSTTATPSSTRATLSLTRVLPTVTLPLIKTSSVWPAALPMSKNGGSSGHATR